MCSDESLSYWSSFIELKRNVAIVTDRRISWSLRRGFFDHLSANSVAGA
jgi:hypothetical protein